MAIIASSVDQSSVMRVSLRAKKSRCIVCEGELEKSNVGMMCHSCKDRLSGKMPIPIENKKSIVPKASIGKFKKTRGVE